MSGIHSAAALPGRMRVRPSQGEGEVGKYFTLALQRPKSQRATILHQETSLQ